MEKDKKIVNLDDYRSYDVSNIFCKSCTYAWVAVFPTTATKLECPECGYMVMNQKGE